MAKLLPSSPLALSGRIGDLVFCHRADGSTYVRAHVPPTNRNTPAQRLGRSRFRDAVAAWKSLSPNEKDAYRLRALGKPGSGYNLFVSEWLATAATDG